MKQYQTEHGTVVEIVQGKDYRTLKELQTLVDKLDILYDAKTSDLNWDAISFCFNHGSRPSKTQL